MAKKLVTFAAVLLFSASAAVAGGGADSFKTLDTDGSGSISRSEFDSNVSKVGDPTMNPTFTMMDKDGNNRIDSDEWSAGQLQKTAIAKGCKASATSWCPCQNNPDDPECQK